MHFANKGGMDLRCMKEMNNALICKWLWHLEVEEENI